MRTLLLLLSLSVVAVGQQAKLAEKCVEGATRKQVVCPKRPAKKNVMAKTITCPSDSGGDCEVFDGAIVRIRPRVGWDTGDPNLATLTVFDLCDGISCVGAVEMLPRSVKPDVLFYYLQIGESCKVGYLPVFDPVGCVRSDLIEAHPVEWPVIDHADLIAPKDGSVIVSGDNSTVVRLAPDEYSHLRQLRAAVVEEEKRLAGKYGADINYCAANHVYCRMPFSDTKEDHYEFHGQFLLIDRGGK